MNTQTIGSLLFIFLFYLTSLSIKMNSQTSRTLLFIFILYIMLLVIGFLYDKI